MESSFDKYQNKSSYPTKDLVNAQFAGKSSDIDSTPMTRADWECAYKQLEHLKADTLKKLKEEYHKESSRLHDLFLKQMEEDHAISKWPEKIKQAIHAEAWDRGHSAGFAEVNNYYYDIVTFVTTILDAWQETKK